MNFNLQKIVLVCSFIFILSGIASARPNPKICRKKNGNVPKPGTSCKGYYECKNYVPSEMTCADGEHFNANKGRCDWENLYPCLEKQKDKECLKENGLFLKPGTNCKKYYRCCNGKAKVENCPQDTLFDPSKGNCEWPNLYTCIESLSTTEKASSAGTVFETFTPSDDQREKTPTDPAISKTPQPTKEIPTTLKPEEISSPRPTTEISTTLEPVEISTPRPTAETPTTFEPEEISTPRPTTEIPTTLEPEKISTALPTTEIPATLEPKEISTLRPTTDIPTTLEPKEFSSARPTTDIPTTLEPEEISTPRPSTEIPTTMKPKEISTSSQPTTTEVLITQSTTTEISLQPTTTKTSTETSSEISKITQTASPQMSSSHSTDQTIFKENKEGEITEPTGFETSMEVTVSPSTAEATTSAELNFMCPEPTGHFPHPTDKHKFVACVSNNPYILDCPNNLVYKHRLRRCDYE